MLLSECETAFAITATGADLQYFIASVIARAVTTDISSCCCGIDESEDAMRAGEEKFSMRFKCKHGWPGVVSFAAGISMIWSTAIVTAQVLPDLRPDRSVANTYSQRLHSTTPFQDAEHPIVSSEPAAWIQGSVSSSDSDVAGIVSTDFSELAPEPEHVSLEDRLLDLEMRLTELQEENELFRNRLELRSLEDNALTTAVPTLLDEQKSIATAPGELTAAVKEEKKEKEKQWYEKMKVRGYAQFRYNRIGETNPDLVNIQGDQSIGDNKSFLLRRARMIFSGDINDRVSYYIQPDFASGVTGPNPLHFLQIRDLYADIFLDAEKEYRIRVGQSKIPYGFENMQSSQNRIAFDRADAVNSGLANERDLGAIFYWAPSEIRDRFKYLVDSGLKGSGDYGVFSFGAYNGQTANRSELNDGLHLVSRLTYPFQFANGQIFEPGIGGYTGTYNITRSAGIGGGDGFVDRRGAISFVLYPQPLGLQGEYTWGEGPELNATSTSVTSGSLEGGHLQVFYKADNVGIHGQKGTLIPYARIQSYDGGRKHETNSPNYRIRETEIGSEYQFSKALELTVAYTWSERTFPVIPHQQEKGELVRMQLQWNY